METKNFVQLTIPGLNPNGKNSASNKKLQDFGEKIGGARKDAFFNLRSEDLEEMSEREAERYATKAYIWPTPNYNALVASCIPVGVAFYRKKLRDAIPAKPIPQGVLSRYTAEQRLRIRKEYVDEVRMLRSVAENLVYEKDCVDLWKEVLVKNGFWENMPFSRTLKGKNSPVICRKLEGVLLVMSDYFFEYSYTKKAVRMGFGTGEVKKAKSRKPRKSRYLPPQLENIERTGPNYRNFDATGEDYMKTFSFRAGEYGNWMSDVDRQASLNMCYDALEDLSFALDIRDTSIAFNGELAIAFGSRGRGAAVAHYEPLRRVINITKMKGAGSLAHEWWHALDDHLGEVLGVHDFVSASRDVYPLMDKLVSACKYKTNPETGRKVKTDFLKGSEAMEKSYAKFGNGYWTDDIELTARAFACYVKDKVPFRSDYLVGHADTAATEDSKAYPVGEERKKINAIFDELFDDLRVRGILEKK